MQSLLYVLWLETEPIKHMGKCLRHIFVFLKLTLYFNTEIIHLLLAFCCCQVLTLLSFSSLCVSRFKEKQPK